ncbi:Protein kinase domain-containing protein [Aspergillus sclerotialis]|uniref:Protein kinase domain-containing protein n=1 Tax=Aspergillus sclerotialis TaxID=2070753 RepID=A0A3A2Z6V6_9EURO|nr:Protein kinase domain-containing protein [Aspergillus sclerotialis]
MTCPLPDSAVGSGYFKRQSMFQEFLEAIDFSQLPLLDDTVTNITLTLPEDRQKSIKIRNGYQKDANPFISNAHRTSYHIAEDPERVMYPILDRSQNLPTIDAGRLEIIEAIAPTVSTVLFQKNKFVYKTIDRPIYIPGDTEHILNEINVLTQFSGKPNIAQLVGVVVSEDPYKTRPSAIRPPVITGLLLEYYSGGSLQQIITENKGHDGSVLRRWALQIGRAIELLHKNNRTHLDIKPSNVVFDANKNAILIDISGTGGYVWEWLSPEMQMIIQQNLETVPATTPFDERVATDCWAFGKLLSTMAMNIPTDGQGERLQSIADDLTRTDPKARISLSDALARI